MDVKNSYLDTENALWANSFALNYLLKHDRTDLSMLELRLCPSHNLHHLSYLNLIFLSYK